MNNVYNDHLYNDHRGTMHISSGCSQEVARVRKLLEQRDMTVIDERPLKHWLLILVGLWVATFVLDGNSIALALALFFGWCWARE
jgi:hypothetical protein